MNEAMASGFLTGAGVDPARMRVIVLTIALGFVFVFGAWMLGRIVELLNDNQMESSDAIRMLVSLFTVLSIVAYLVIKS